MTWIQLHRVSQVILEILGALGSAVAGVSGKHFVNKITAKSFQTTYDKDLAQRLWDASSELTQLTSPDIQTV